MANTYKLNQRKGKFRKNLISFLNDDDELPLQAGKVSLPLKKPGKFKKGNSLIR